MVERCNGFRCSLTKNAVPVTFMRARSFNQNLIARNSSSRNGCEVDSPPFKRAMCNTLLWVSIWSSFKRHASDTRNPCLNMSNNKQRSRASFLLPLVASIRLRTSSAVKCFRSLSPSLCHASFFLPPAPRCRPVFPCFRPCIVLSRVWVAGRA